MITMKLYGYEVNTCNYKKFSTGQLDEFRSMLKSNIRNFNELVEPTIEAMIDEDKAEELLAYIESEIKVRDRNN
ncbi:hypothetical protein HMPREF5175_00939 [Lactobacillus gasseri SV-16A-US]|nr:hypothetical protein HMPREF5175_00939 [Lactobacillus gasseri SV-16A-US]